MHPKGANNMAMYGLGCEKSLVGVGLDIKCNRPRKESLALYSLQFQGSRPIFLLK